jgi:hypothetical protein
MPKLLYRCAGPSTSIMPFQEFNRGKNTAAPCMYPQTTVEINHQVMGNKLANSRLASKLSANVKVWFERTQQIPRHWLWLPPSLLNLITLIVNDMYGFWKKKNKRESLHQLRNHVNAMSIHVKEKIIYRPSFYRFKQPGAFSFEPYIQTMEVFIYNKNALHCMYKE